MIKKFFYKKQHLTLKCCRLSLLKKICSICVLSASTFIIVMLFASDIYKMLRDNNGFNYTMGGNMINYSAGFVRRGLYGEIIQLLNSICQPFLSEMFLSFISLLFIFYIIITRMKRLNVQLTYILAIIFSPSLILLHRDQEIFRTDVIAIALNLVVSIILLNCLSTRHKSTYMGGEGMIL